MIDDWVDFAMRFITCKGFILETGIFLRGFPRFGYDLRKLWGSNDIARGDILQSELIAPTL